MQARSRLLALGAACAVFAVLLLALNALLPAQESQADPAKDYGYVYSGAKSASTGFCSAAMGKDAVLLFGSSELSTPPSLVPQVPANIFGVRDCGVSLMCIGEAYDQSLWHAIAAGAFAQRVGPRKVAIIVSPTWFVDGGLSSELFETRFSYSLYRSFMANPSLSDQTKAYVQQRVAQQGIDGATVRAGARADAPSAINDIVFSFLDDMHARRKVQEVSRMGFAVDKAAVEPDFAALRQQALADAQQRTATNEWGLDDEFWAQNVAGREGQIAGALAAETFSDTPEYDDFGCFLRVCQESGLEPLVVVSPIQGDYYDLVGVAPQTRRASYDHILEVCNAYGVAVADFSDREYERYFLHDQVHFGWTGWVDVCEAIYRFAKGA